MRQRVRPRNLEDITTIKVTSPNLVLLSKLLSDLRSRFKVLSSSSILVSSENHCYFCYLNIENSEVAERLQGITPYTKETRF